ncbi:MAG: hypothetical protein IKQ33_00625 [Clostridia bacterium]|nr:hypothetical protein [Clostridia bacterium]
MNTSVDIKKIFELIDLYKYASVSGERVEVIITPFDEDGKWDDTKRKITIGLQGGFSRDRDTFVVENAREFDQIILPQILAYFSCDDALGKWDVITPSVENQTCKGTSETQNGNVVYLETFDEKLYDYVNEQKDIVEQKTTYKKNTLTDNDKVWDEIILYAKRRRVAQDFFEGTSLTDKEKDALYNFVVNVSNERSISISNDKKYRDKNEKFMHDLFKDKDKLLSLGLDDELIDKIAGTPVIKKLANLAGNEKRIRRRVDVENPEIASKIKFAIEELEKVGYYDLRNASSAQFEKGQLVSKQPGAIIDLKEKVSSKEYESFCDEVLEYLEHKANNSKKIVETEVEQSTLLFEPYDDAVVDSYGKFDEALELITQGKLDDERYEIVVESDAKNKEMRRVRISLMDGVSRNDTFNFLFTDGKTFDEEFKKRLEDIHSDDPNFMSEINYTNVPEIEGFIKTALHKSTKNNEILIKGASEDLAFLGRTKEVKREIAEENTEAPKEEKEDLITKLKRLEKQINAVAEEQDKKEIVEEVKKEAPKEDLITKLKRLEKQINTIAEEQDKELDTTVSFEMMHEYVRDYKISNENGPLQVFYRRTHEEYVPKSEAEKRNIEFALYWATKAGLYQNREDVVEGERYAFNEESKKLFNLFDVQFKESVRRGIDVDLESLREQFHSSGVKGADDVYEHLFENKYYLEYVLEYYRKSLGVSKSKDNNLKDLGDLAHGATEQAQELETINETLDILNNAKRFAKEINEMQELNSIRESAKLEARKIYAKEEYKNIRESAKKEAERLLKINNIKVNENKFEKLTKDELNINNNFRDEEILKDVDNQAREIIKKQENRDIKNSALEEALRLYDNIDLVFKDAPNQAVEIIAKEEKENAKKAAVNQALAIRDAAEKEEVKKGAPIQAQLLIDEAVEEDKPSMFEVAKEEDENFEEINPELTEIQDAFEVVEDYASSEQPTTVKIFFDKEDNEHGDVIISNGIGADETVMYERTFDIEALRKSVLPLLCKLYAANNDVTYNNVIHNPYTSRADFVVLGTNEKAFQVSGEKEFVEECQMMLNSELYKTKNNENEKTR